jgi:hypothetical protein
MILFAAFSLEAQQMTNTFSSNKCEQFLYRDPGEGRLTDMLSRFESFNMALFDTGAMAFYINFNDGSMPIEYMCFSSQTLQDGSQFFSQVHQADPETGASIGEGFTLSWKLSGQHKMALVVFRGVVQYLSIVILE